MNRLQHETSPYLLQHATNPVDWHTWSDEAFQLARSTDRPVIVSIGYATCHWCHVMERESFESEAVAAYMNQHFVCIKVDREERPDVDQIYMDAVQAMGVGGGWPLNVFLLPDGRPFYGGTYFPPTPMHQRPSWSEILQRIAQVYQTNKTGLLDNAVRLTERMTRMDDAFVNRFQKEKENNSHKNTIPYHIYNAFHSLKAQFDTEYGGFGAPPKFPQTTSVKFLLDYYYFSGDKDALRQAELSLQAMLNGGIYDQIGGGLSRYSTDSEWLVPHFEKMLYDNALFINVLTQVYAYTNNEVYKETIEQTLEYVQREMTAPEGAFYTAQDADSEGEEGKYYVWTKAEIDELLYNENKNVANIENNADLYNNFCVYYDITNAGNWEGNIILRKKNIFIQNNENTKLDTQPNEKKHIFANYKVKLLAEREKRIKPLRDEKILLAWNALMTTAYCKSYIILQKKDYKTAALQNMAFILQAFIAEQTDSDALFHTYKDGKRQHLAFLDDYAYLIESLINLYHISFDTQYLYLALRYTDYVIQNFADPQSPAFFYTDKAQAELIVRKKDWYDGALPSGNATMANNLLKLSVYFERADLKTRAELMVQQLQAAVEQYPLSFAKWAEAMVLLAYPIWEIAILGKNAENIATELLQKNIPNLLIMASNAPNEDFILTQNRYPKAENETYIYMCRNNVCHKPVTNLENLLKFIKI